MASKDNLNELPSANRRIQEIINRFARGNVAAFIKTVDGISHQSLNRIFNVDSRTGKFPAVSGKIIESITKAYPSLNTAWILHGTGNMTNDKTQEAQSSHVDPSIDNLAKALADQAQASKMQAAANVKYAEGFATLATIMERIEKNMARREDQATLAASLNEVLAGVETIADRQGDAIKQILADLSIIKTNKIVPS
jgi:uncharacterized protein YicC (UPF0701 family)